MMISSLLVPRIDVIFLVRKSKNSVYLNNSLIQNELFPLGRINLVDLQQVIHQPCFCCLLGEGMEESKIRCNNSIDGAMERFRLSGEDSSSRGNGKSLNHTSKPT